MLDLREKKTIRPVNLPLMIYLCSNKQGFSNPGIQFNCGNNKQGFRSLGHWIYMRRRFRLMSTFVVWWKTQRD